MLGRVSDPWSTPWDDQISRRHAEAVWAGEMLKVRRLTEARNPLFVRGKPADEFSLKPGEHFVIGKTSFTVAQEQVHLSLDLPHPATEQTFSAAYLRQLRLSNDQRLEVLGRLPDIISGASSDTELSVRLVNLLLTGIPRAAAAALVVVKPDEGAVDVQHWDRRRLTGEDFRPSERLIRQAVSRRESVLHVWTDAAQRSVAHFTQAENADWAFCTPVSGSACPGWAIYVSGQFAPTFGTDKSSSESQDLLYDLKFT